MTFAPAVAIFVTFASAVRWADSTLRMAEEIKKAINGIESQLAAELTRQPETCRAGATSPVDLGEERAAIDRERGLAVRFEVPINWALE